MELLQILDFRCSCDTNIQQNRPNSSGLCVCHNVLSYFFPFTWELPYACTRRPLQLTSIRGNVATSHRVVATRYQKLVMKI